MDETSAGCLFGVGSAGRLSTAWLSGEEREGKPRREGLVSWSLEGLMVHTIGGHISLSRRDPAELPSALNPKPRTLNPKTYNTKF